jgi:hypothetical protein
MDRQKESSATDVEAGVVEQVQRGCAPSEEDNNYAAWKVAQSRSFTHQVSLSPGKYFGEPTSGEMNVVVWAGMSL